MDTIGKRLEWARKQARYESPTDAARAHGWAVSTYLGHENSDRNPKRPIARRYAKAFKVRWEWLLEGDGPPSAKPATAPVLGYVGAGAEIFPFDDFPGEALDEVDLPATPANTVAVIVRGDSMYPRYFDGERIFYTDRETPPKELIGQECVIKLSDGAMMVKMLRKGTKARHFNLESWNAPLIEDKEVEWAAPIKWRG